MQYRDFLAVKDLGSFHVTFFHRRSLLNLKKTYWASSASSSGTMLPLLTEPRRAIFGGSAGALIRSSVNIDYCQNMDNIVILTIVHMTKPIIKVEFQFWYQYHNYFLPKPSVFVSKLKFFSFPFKTEGNIDSDLWSISFHAVSLWYR